MIRFPALCLLMRHYLVTGSPWVWPEISAISMLCHWDQANWGVVSVCGLSCCVTSRIVSTSQPLLTAFGPIEHVEPAVEPSGESQSVHKIEMKKKGEAPWASHCSIYDLTHFVWVLLFFAAFLFISAICYFFYQTHSQLEVVILATVVWKTAALS